MPFHCQNDDANSGLNKKKTEWLQFIFTRIIFLKSLPLHYFDNSEPVCHLKRSQLSSYMSTVVTTVLYSITCAQPPDKQRLHFNMTVCGGDRREKAETGEMPA